MKGNELIMALLTAFGALSMAGTVILSLLPEGGVKRTASLAIGLLMLMCWAEGISALLGLRFTADKPPTALIQTEVSIEDAASAAASFLTEQREAAP